MDRLPQTSEATRIDVELKDYSLSMPVPERPTDGSTPWRRAALTPARLARVADGLGAAGESLARLSDERLLNAWQGMVRDLLDPASTSRRAIDPYLATAYGMSPPALAAALECILRGVRGQQAEAIFRQGAGRTQPSPLLVVLASNIPALALQALLPALALRRPVLLKSASAEPCLVPLLVDRLVAHEPALRPALAALAWPGGERSLEEPVMARVGQVIAYGGGDAMDDLERRVGNKLLSFGPKLSLAVLGAEVDAQRVAAGLARDIALFEQRGCLSIQGIVTFGDARALADALAAALQQLAVQWPRATQRPRTGRQSQATTPSADLAELSRLQQLRDEATMLGLYQPHLGIDEGTIVVEDGSHGFELQPSPGGRCVRIYSVDDDETLKVSLGGWKGRLQGIALAGTAWRLESFLQGLGVSRLAAVGQLQQPDSNWRNGGVSLLEALADGG